MHSGASNPGVLQASPRFPSVRALLERCSKPCCPKQERGALGREDARLSADVTAVATALQSDA